MQKPFTHCIMSAYLAVLMYCAIVVLSGKECIAQPITSCRPCIMGNGSGVMNVNFVLNDGCLIQAAVSVNPCVEGGCYTLRVSRITFQSEDCKFFCPDHLAKLVIGRILVQNIVNVPFDTANGTGCVYVVQPKCWRRVVELDPCGYSDNMLLRLMPCDTTDCCMSVVKYTKEPCGADTLWTASDGDSTEAAEILGLELYQRQLDSTRCETCTPPSPISPLYPTECPRNNECYFICVPKIIEEYFSTNPFYNMNRK